MNLSDVKKILLVDDDIDLLEQNKGFSAEDYSERVITSNE